MRNLLRPARLLEVQFSNADVDLFGPIRRSVIQLNAELSTVAWLQSGARVGIKGRFENRVVSLLENRFAGFIQAIDCDLDLL